MNLLANEDRERPYSPDSRPTPHDILSFLSYACYQLESTFQVKVIVQTQGDYQRVEERSKKSRRSVQPTPPPAGRHPSATTGTTDDQESEMTSPVYIQEADEVVITAVMNTSGHLVEIIFNRCVDVPRILLKVIGLCIPYQPNLRRFTVRWGPLNDEGLYEISKFLSGSYLTEICLDDSPVDGCNYEVLLERPYRLNYLSLTRCQIDDDDCEKLASLLAYPLPASKTLNILILVSNMIGDRGAHALGEILRTNRSLQCLNLAGNYITDSGAMSILKSLMEFALTADEIFSKRAQHFEYLKLKDETFARCVKELHQEKSQDEFRLTKRRPTVRHRKISNATGLSSSDTAAQKALAMTIEKIGVFSHPFIKEQTTLRADRLYCIGNTSLCCLNLSYNNLEYPSLPLAYEVLVQQSWLGVRATPGLLRLSVEGNKLPADCDEFVLIDDLLERANTSRGRQQVTKRSVDKSRTSRQPHR